MLLHVADLYQAKDSRQHVSIAITDGMRDQYRRWRNERAPPQGTVGKRPLPKKKTALELSTFGL